MPLFCCFSCWFEANLVRKRPASRLMEGARRGLAGGIDDILIIR